MDEFKLDDSSAAVFLTYQQLQELMQMQDTLNSYIHPEWRTQGFDWVTAQVDELMELKEHLGWKWWKANYQCGMTPENQKQVQLEVIDLLHFVLSDCAQRNQLPYTLYTDSMEATRALELSRHVTHAMQWCISDQGLNLAEWASLAVKVGLTGEQVIETYIAKYTLNVFRQDHGYKTGEYDKHWLESRIGTEPDAYVVTLEDNQVLEEAITEAKKQGEVISVENLTRWLTIAYSKHKQLKNGE